ncbi:MAG: ATP synthase F1 subunit gamma [Bdellovibrionota bacterium]|jgi:F-type H+-transporting ATPase subunit gamma
MAGLKEIKRRIRSVKNTEKITYAMKLVSAAKLRKVQDALLQTREYATALESLLQRIIVERTQEAATLPHPIMKARQEIRRVRLIVIGGRRGLCGAYNSNLNRLLDKALTRYQKGVEIEIVVIGTKPAEYCKRKGYNYISDYEDLSDNVEEWPLSEIYDSAESAFINQEIDEVTVLFTRFQSAMSVTPSIEKLLPFSTDFHNISDRANNKILYEPSAEEVVATLMPRYAQAKLLLVCLEAKASEQGSRMTAMDSATHNAGELIDSLVITHNKLRQSSITNDILDIIGGSSVKK